MENAPSNDKDPLNLRLPAAASQLAPDGSQTDASKESPAVHPQVSQPASVGSPPDAPEESAPQSFGSFMHAFLMDPEAAAARELYLRHLPPDVREGIMQQAAELAGLDVEDIFHDAQEAPAAEIEVQQERNFWQQIVTTALQFGGIVVIGVLAAAARGGGANAEQRRNRPG